MSHEWNLFEEGGDLFLLRSASPFVFAINLATSPRWTWVELRAALEAWLEGRKPALAHALPVKPVLREALVSRLCFSFTLVSWSDGEVGRVHHDDLPPPAQEFLRQVDAPTFGWLERRKQFKEMGLTFDGAWMPTHAGRVIALLERFGASPVTKEAGWFFQERTIASQGALIDLYEVRRSGWGFALRGLSQREVMDELEALLMFSARNGLCPRQENEPFVKEVP